MHVSSNTINFWGRNERKQAQDNLVEQIKQIKRRLHIEFYELNTQRKVKIARL